MTKPSLTTIEHEVDEADMADAQFTGYYVNAAIAEARMLLERNEPKGPDHYMTPIGMLAFFDLGSALAEALAAFVAE